MITLEIGHGLGLVHRSHSKLSRLALLTDTPNDEKGAAENSNKDNRDGNSSYSSCTNTMRAIIGGFNDGSVARGWISDRITSCGGMRYGNNMARYRHVKGCLRD